jgi:dTDP-4-amino-4,6-dideoxygalactose transaminase
MIRVPFTRPFVSPFAAAYVAEAMAHGHLSGDGPFSKRVRAWLESAHPSRSALLVHSGTAALELCALLLDLAPGDEVIMPSFTFTSTANAVALRGATPVFVDIDDRTMNVDPECVRAAITARTKAIFVVHYAGIAADLDALTNIAREFGLALVEDAAQAIGSQWRGVPLGAVGDLGCLSFHATKNLGSGEGGALIVRPEYAPRAEQLREKGTDRSQFLRGEVDRYTWRDVGSSYLPNELTAAFLLAQLESCDLVTAARRASWYAYHQQLEALEHDQVLVRPVVPTYATLNGHIYFVRCNSPSERDALIRSLAQDGYGATFHYQPLHDTPAGRRYARTHGSMERTLRAASSLVRLPLWHGVGEHVPHVVRSVERWAAAHRAVCVPGAGAEHFQSI